MSMPDPEKISVTSATGLALVALKEVSDTPGGASARHELGRSAATVARFVNNMLLPVAAVNFAFEKARCYFETKFEDDLAAKMSGTAADEIVEPKPSIAAPVLEGLAFAHDEEQLKELFLDLLKNSMSRDTAELIHPAYSAVIKQLSANEASSLRTILKARTIAVLRASRQEKGADGGVVARRYIVTCSGESSKAIEAWIDNWQRLGLIEVDFMRQFTAKDVWYKPLRERKEFADLKTAFEADGAEMKDEEGIIRVTSFGEGFGRAIS